MPSAFEICLLSPPCHWEWFSRRSLSLLLVKPSDLFSEVSRIRHCLLSCSWELLLLWLWEYLFSFLLNLFFWPVFPLPSEILFPIPAPLGVTSTSISSRCLSAYLQLWPITFQTSISPACYTFPPEPRSWTYLISSLVPLLCFISARVLRLWILLLQIQTLANADPSPATLFHVCPPPFHSNSYFGLGFSSFNWISVPASSSTLVCPTDVPGYIAPVLAFSCSKPFHGFELVKELSTDASFGIQDLHNN